MEPLLVTNDLNKSYSDFRLSGISMEIHPGSIVGIFGPNGAGKTTLVKLLAGQISADSGALLVFGSAYAEREKEIKDRIGYAPQEPPYFPDRTAEYLGRFASRFYSRWDGGRFSRLLNRFHISPQKKFRHLSGGQKTLFSLALALSHQPDLLLLDEPAAGLDDAHRRFLLDTLRDFVSGGDRAAVVCSHVSEGLDEVSERVLILHHGRMILDSDKEELLERWKRVDFRDNALDPALVASLAGLRRHPFGNSGLCSDFPALHEKIACGLAAGDVKVENARLSDVLIHLTQGE
ncbi:MAG: hypothetical protein A2Y56_12550 [Candidatus Aminicenantes bacterium RBG_13_63_10]|nr:MAG: hypothetical protein A2Y56_12550 [Candidatus Aminicenantes bacterium RBG_13_63_10]